jgi:hypothetical protein
VICILLSIFNFNKADLWELKEPVAREEVLLVAKLNYARDDW